MVSTDNGELELWDGEVGCRAMRAEIYGARLAKNPPFFSHTRNITYLAVGDF